ncbi:MAG TPA: phosphonate C-P lyase system protein PhnG [Arenibaculum sp.]|nr:phosphonate C-P lyase system protein PhnG [Arenibaculum sp.]
MSEADGDDSAPAVADRRRWMGVLARGRRDELEAAWAGLGDPPPFEWLRRPETGLVMVRGRAGGDGAPFNLGEMTVTRCAVRLIGGGAGIAYIRGRDARKAELAALFDAMLQQAAHRAGIEAAVVEPLARAQAERASEASRRAAATKVDFFTMVRGDNPK